MFYVAFLGFVTAATYAVFIYMQVMSVSISSLIKIALVHPFLILFIWAYYKVVTTDPGSPPKTWNTGSSLQDGDIEMGDLNIEYQPKERNLDGTTRFCHICDVLKPDRTHHCSICGRCILKFDHHCPWVSNCVGFRNYKFFVQFLGYGFLYSTYTLAFMDHLDIYEVLNNGTAFAILYLFEFGALVVMIVSFIVLVCYHLGLISKNVTTIEGIRTMNYIYDGGQMIRTQTDVYDEGLKNNFIQVFGDKPIGWFLPIELPKIQYMNF